MRIEIKERTVCFLDLLGFSDAVAAAGANHDKLAEISNLVDTVHSEVIERYDRTNLIFQHLSDSIFVSTPDNDADHIEDLFRCIQDVVIYFLKKGFAVRGGVASGPCCVSSDIILGEPVVRAVKIESKIAVFPRVAIGKSTQEIIQESVPVCRSMIRRESDGVFWLDPFASSVEDLLRIHDKWLSSRSKRGEDEVFYRGSLDDILRDINCIVDVIQRNLDEISENQRVFEKYYWLARGMDEAFSSSQGRVGKELKCINLSL